MTTLSPLPPSTTAAGPRPGELVQRLRAAVDCTVLAAGETGYADLVTPWNVAVTMAPQAVVAARTAADVAATVRLAGELGVTVGVQSRGHGAHGALAGDVLVTTRDLDELQVHVGERWARLGAGVRGADVVAATAPHGLLPLLGSSTDVGVVGLLTGGGVGPLARTYGLCADRVRAMEVVTGDGALRRVTPGDDAELFAALRGGKGAAGIVTAVELDLLPVTTFFGGALYFDGADAAAVLHSWRTWSAELPEEATTSVALLQLPDAPFVPPPLAGRLSVALRFAWTGDPATGSRHLDAVRTSGRLLVDDVSVKPASALDSVHADPVDPMPAHEAAALLRELPPDAVDTVLAMAGPGSPSPQLMVELRRLGGALSRPGQHPTAFVHRAAEYNLFCVGIAMDPRVAGHGGALVAAMEPWSTGGVWPNYGTAHDAASALRAYDAPTLDLLSAVVSRVDPAGVLVGGAPFRTPSGDSARP